jgi:acyl-ACP thioesterase
MINDRGIPTRIPDEFQQFVADNASFDMAKVALPEVPPNAVERRFDVRRRDLDPMDHVNNSVYLDYFEEALAAAGHGDALAATPRRYVLDFANSAARGDSLVDTVWPGEGGWCYKLSRDGGAVVFRGRLER